MTRRSAPRIRGLAPDRIRPRLGTGWKALLFLSLTPLVPLGGCAGPGYFAQAIGGHLGLMRARMDPEEALAAAAGDERLETALRQANDILAFARLRLGLPESENYRQVVITGRDAVTWNVVAAPEFSVEPRRWCFPVAGCVPYRGYFDRERAEAFADKRAARGEDVLVSPATAYSTLGWFDDPLLDTMFRYGEGELAAVLFHELAHERLYVSGDTAFNEAYASFVASAGVRRWAEATGKPELAERFEQRQRATRDFSALLAATRARLARLYDAGGDEPEMRMGKNAIFEQMRASYRELVAGPWAGRDWFARWMAGPLNNAHLALMAQYDGGECAFAALFREADGDFERFHQLAEALSRRSADHRAAWLATDCGSFASVPDL